MSEIATTFCGLTFRNPILPAAGPPGRNGAALLDCARGGAGGLVSKTVSAQPAAVPVPNMAEVPGGLLNCELWSELPLEQWVAQEYPLAREAGLPLIVSLGYTAEDVRALAPRIRPYADAVELSTHYIGEDARPMQEAIAAAHELLDVPVIAKLSPLGRDVAQAARAAVEAGADAIAAINSFGPCLALDPDTGRPLLGSEGGYGWLSGPALRPLALRCVAEIARAVSVPVIGVGGITSGADAAEMLMAGARAVGVCTAAILHGPGIYGRIAAELAAWLDAHGYTSPQEISGLSLRQTTQGQPLHARVDPERCTGCRRCLESCVYQAIALRERKAVVEPDLCAACGLCVTRCRSGAIGLLRKRGMGAGNTDNTDKDGCPRPSCGGWAASR